VNKQLADWIKSEEAKGYPERQLKEYLLKQGYSIKDIDEAIKSFDNDPLAPSPLKKLLKPTILKLFFPVLALILISMSFIVNSTYFNSVGESLCNRINNGNELRDISEISSKKVLENNADPEELIELYKKSDLINKQIISLQNNLIASTVKIVEGNIYFTASMIHKLNPLFPMPCESLFLGTQFANSKYCRYYINEEVYNCIREGFNEQNTHFDSKGDAGMSLIALFFTDFPQYKKISPAVFLIHSILLCLIIYILVSIVSLFRKKLLEKDTKIKVVAYIIILPIIFFFAMHYVYLIFPAILVVVFMISSFIKNDKNNKVFLYISAFILILLLIGGFFGLRVILGMTLVGLPVDEPFIMESSTEYKIFYCENTKILSIEEKQQLINDEVYIDEEWNVCSNPSCDDICTNYCIQKENYGITILNLRGDRPSCICGC